MLHLHCEAQQWRREVTTSSTEKKEKKRRNFGRGVEQKMSLAEDEKSV